MHWNFNRIQATDVEQLHADGYMVCVYTIDAPTDFKRAVDRGIDLITTNEPRRLLDWSKAQASSGY